eukprot:g2436.t1
MISNENSRSGSNEPVIEEPAKKKRKVASEEDVAKEAFGSIDITKIMNSEGPVCKCVLLQTDGTAKEIDVDMTPKKQKVPEILGGRTSFVGQWDDIGVIVCCADQSTTNEDIEKNTHKLQPPLHKAVIRGPIVLTRSGEHGEPLDFTLKEWDEFKARDIPEWEVEEADAPAEESDEEGEEEDEEEDGEDAYNPSEEDDDDEDDGFDGFIDMLLGRIVQQFVEKNGREPTHQEAQELEDALRLKLGGGPASEENEDSADDAKPESATMTEESTNSNVEANTDGDEAQEQPDAKEVLDLLIQEFQKQNGRMPTNDEMKQWITALKGDGDGASVPAEAGELCK